MAPLDSYVMEPRPTANPTDGQSLTFVVFTDAAARNAGKLKHVPSSLAFGM